MHCSPRDLVESFHVHLNCIDPNIQFTVERESEGQLPFLDVLLTREDDGGISTSVFRKATHMDQYLAYESHHPTAHKKAVVRTLMCRAETLSSSGGEPGSGRRACTAVAPKEWVPCRLHHETQSPTATPTK